ncbi:zinc ABC transporter substrate-binding protein ZnuA [Sodalis ligni]|jgi:zinc transport system substrate-binding protein|uniref:High-affinity zinc uptake system protein ZnuA n=1 Tax=Sodalis ligni TaxID=2697027 RepID=A0A4R1N730_9GAMM|nr:zinc ABC transporter substrate-binding protein ZnuA [Sodalis ligni]TCL02319.1 zinc transport system substrate-binding protein [Sodalis ligni]
MNPRHKKGFRLWLAGILLLCAIGGQARANILVSIRPLGFIASAIGEGVTGTDVLLPDGASPHDYALRPSDIGRIRDASLVVWVGPELEAFMARPVTALPAAKALTLSAIPAIKPLLMKGGDHDDDAPGAHDPADDADDHHGEYNMHIWLSPEIAAQVAIAIHDRLVQLWPDKKAQIDENLLFFTTSLTKNDKIIATMLSPASGKGYFVFHDAYGYFEKHYGLTSLGYFTINPEIQPGAQALHNIRTQLVEHKALCIFAEPQFRPAVINAVARGTDVRMGTLDPLGSGIALGKDSYSHFLFQLANQYMSCLNKKS